MATLYQKRLEDSADRQPESLQVLALTFSQRQRSRLAAMLPNGKAAAIVLARGEFMAPGDVLLSQDGQGIRIEAQPEDLMKISAATPFELMRLTYHLANRHVRAMLTPQAVYIEPDTILADMVRRLGGSVEWVCDVFLPETGAYGGGHHHHGEADDTDRAMGNLGELLSIEAHQRSVT